MKNELINLLQSSNLTEEQYQYLYELISALISQMEAE